MIAKYQGADGSMGFRSGRVYHLDVDIILISVDSKMTLNPCIVVSDNHGHSCPYSSLDSLQRNWELIR